MEQPKIELAEVLEEPKVVLDEEDVAYLMHDCYQFIAKMMQRNNPRALQAEGNKLVERIEETLFWHKIH